MKLKTEKIKAVKVVIHWKEGVIGPDRFEYPMEILPTEHYDVFNQFHGMINQYWRLDAPAPGRGYDKIKFSVVFADGYEYTGRYDLQNTGLNDAGETLKEQILNYVKFDAGQRKPSHMTVDQYLDVVSEAKKSGLLQHSKDFLETYDI